MQTTHTETHFNWSGNNFANYKAAVKFLHITVAPLPIILKFMFCLLRQKLPQNLLLPLSVCLPACLSVSPPACLCAHHSLGTFVSQDWNHCQNRRQMTIHYVYQVRRQETFSYWHRHSALITVWRPGPRQMENMLFRQNIDYRTTEKTSCSVSTE